MTTIYNSNIIINGLNRYIDVSNVKSYPGTGTSLFDLTNTFDSTISSGMYGLYNNVVSLDFDGTYGSTGMITSGTTGITSSSFTVDVWCRSTDNDRANGTQGRVIASTYQYQGSSTLKDTGWYLGTVWTGTYFTFAVFDGVGNSAGASLPSGFYTNFYNVWTNITGVFWAGSFVKIYQNGNLMQTAGTSIMTLSEQNDPLVWCRRSANAQSNWKGQFSSGRYYNRALSDAEVKQNFNAMRRRHGL